MGYRPLEIDDMELEQICAEIDTADNDRARLKHFKPLQDILRRVQIGKFYFPPFRHLPLHMPSFVLYKISQQMTNVIMVWLLNSVSHCSLTAPNILIR